MNDLPQLKQSNITNDHCRLRPLVWGIRWVIASGLLVGSNVSTADTPLPVPTFNAITPGQVPVPIIANAANGQATAAIAGNAMNIRQITDKATIDWKSFNIDHGYSVNFQQPNSSSVALNRIHDANATQILGALNANGQVYLVNTNGILFGNGSVVDTNGLVASALNITDEALKTGIIRVFDKNINSQEMEVKAALNGNTNDIKTAVNPNAKVTVAKGANIHVGKNGSIILAAPTVSNAGKISTDEQGQILLVASKDAVYLQPTSDKDPFAGLLVEVGKGGKVSNEATGQIASSQGNVTLAGFAVNQSGRISATTSINVNGSVRLLARENAIVNVDRGNSYLSADQTVRTSDMNDGLKTESAVTFGKNSSVTILADNNGEKAIDEQAQKQSIVEVSADKIEMQSGSSIAVTGGNVNLQATNNLTAPLLGNQGRIVLEKGSLIDVSGSKNVTVAMESNVADVSVQSFNLRDAPYQRGGVLQGKTVKVDIRNLPTIADASSAKASIKRDINERLGNGGSINLNSSGDVIVNTGAVTDISGGAVTYRSGYIKTTGLIDGVTGQVVDISAADPDQYYSGMHGIITESHNKWGVTNSWGVASEIIRYESGYTEGKAGGTLNIQSPVTAWGGQLIAGTETSIYQRSNPVSGGTFTINQFDNGGSTSPEGQFLSSQNVLFQNNQPIQATHLDDVLPNNSPLVLSSGLVNESGISNLTIKTAGSATIANDVSLSMPVLSKLAIDASAIEVKGSVYTSGGDITLNAINTGNTNTGQINLKAGSQLDVSGRWVNDFQNGISSPLVINAGKVALSANNQLIFAKGASIRADGGAHLNARVDQITAGDAGSVNLQAGNSSFTGLMKAEGFLAAYGLNQGGSLNITTNKINIGSNLTEANALNLGTTNGRLTIADAGFSNISLTSNVQDITVKANTHLTLMAQNRFLNANYRYQNGSSSLGGFSRVTSLPENIRKPVSLSLTGKTGVTLESGSQIHVDKSSTVNLTSDNMGSGLYINGLIDAQGGVINLNLKADNALSYDNSQAIWLGSQASLNTKGTTLLNPYDVLGWTTGKVINGGNVTINADRGYVILEQGSKIDVSGTSASLKLPVGNADNSGFHYANQIVGSDAGKINIRSAEGIVLDGKVSAEKGSMSNRGGDLSLTLDRNLRNEPTSDGFPLNSLHIDVTQNDTKLLPTNLKFGSIMPDKLNGQVVISSNKIEQAGIDNLSLSLPYQIDPLTQLARLPGEVRFLGDVNLTTASSIVLDAQTISSGVEGLLSGATNLQTAYLKMGSSTIDKTIGSAIKGDGQLTSTAKWTELQGASLLTGFKDIHLKSLHDMRVLGVRPNATDRTFTGNLNTAANLSLDASQIYPTTLTKFTFDVTDPTSQLTILGHNSDITPLSAAGNLTFNAAVINQNGVLKAPFGKIELNASKNLVLGKESYTSVSAEGQIIPFGSILNNVWMYPLDSTNNLVFNTLPDNLTVGEKHLVFKSPDIEFNKGSVVNVSGGGDLMTSTFLPGAGGSYDYLMTQDGFAVLPSQGTSLAPYDPNLSVNFPHDPRAQVYLSGTAALPSGFYTILPASYALLPGAFLVTPQKNTVDQSFTSYTQTGLPIVSGYQTIAGTNIRDSRNSGFLIESSADFKKHSAYDIQTANSFFTQQAIANRRTVPLLPQDSGQISIEASTRLLLNGQFDTSAPNGRGAKMDISSSNIEVVNQLGGSSGSLELLADDLSKLKVDSLLLGGSRTINNYTGNTQIAVLADNVIFDRGVKLKTHDLLTVAKNSVQVKAGAILDSSGKVNTGDSSFNIVGDGALLRLSGDKQVTLNRSSSTGLTGDLLIDKGAILKASQSIFLDSSNSTMLNGDINMLSGALSMSAKAINLGEVAGLSNNALNLTNQKLKSFSGDDLTLTSRSGINFYGNVGELDSTNQLTPVQFNHLVMDAAGLVGFNNAGKTAMLKANTIDLKNSQGSTVALNGSGTGLLELSAAQFNQGSGNLGLSGFRKININVDKQFTATGNGVLNVASDVNLTAGLITSKSGANLLIDASSGGGHDVSINGNFANTQALANDFGGGFAVTANNIKFQDANVILHSGSLKLNSQSGDITINGNSDINLSGQAVYFADVLKYTPGGNFSAIANQGKVSFGRSTKLDISKADDSAAGGNIIIKAPEKTIALDGTIKAKGASATIELSEFSVAQSFDNVMNKLMSAGVSGSLYFRSHLSDITQAAGNILTAKSLTLVADKGAIDIAGSLKSDGISNGGEIKLYAGDKITLENSAQITAKGANKGGNVMLSSVDSLASNHSGVEIKSGATIDVSSSTAKTGGVVTLSAMRTADGINIKPVNGTIRGYRNFYAEGTQKYSHVNFDQINLDTANYMNAASSNVAQLAPGIVLRPGVEVDYRGDLALANPLDFSNQRFGANLDIPGTLILTASGKLDVNNSITDGFQGSQLQKGDSWTFQLVSGADQTSADKFATTDLTNAERLINPMAKDLTIGTGVSVHTGSGDIKLASGGNIVFTDQTSTVYNAGRVDATNPYGTLDNTHSGTGVLAGTILQSFLAGEYPILGGDMVFHAGGNIVGAVSNQFIQPWLQRQGMPYNINNFDNYLTSWRVDATQFQQNIGSFGGGNVDIVAAGNINDLSVMMPTTGKQLGTDFSNDKLDIQGGGLMNVTAGGNISGGAYFLGKGEGTLSAGVEIKGSDLTDANAFTAGPQLVMSGNPNDAIAGNSLLTLNANQGLKISGLSDAMVLNHNGTQFFTYTDKSKLALNSMAGDIHLNSDISVISSILGIDTTPNSQEQYLAHVYPASLDATSFSGSIKLDSDIILFPSPVSNLNILAKQDITSGIRQSSLIMSDADSSLLPTAYNPIADNSDPQQLTAGSIFDTLAINSGTGNTTLLHANIPAHKGDKNPARIITQHGDISSVQINLPKQSIIQAGNDLLNASIQLQQIDTNDASIISAGRDIAFITDLDSNGNPTQKNATYMMEVAGPGNVLVKSGRNIDLGSSVGISTVGNVYNPGLSSNGSSMDVIVGLNEGAPNYAAFIDKYISGNPLYKDQFVQINSLITGYMQQQLGGSSLSESQALIAFGNLTGDKALAIQPQLNAIISKVFFNELKIGGSASASNKSIGNASGFAVIDTLFPDNKWKGDLSLFFSKLQTISGGDINIMVPGGQVNAGVAVVSEGAKSADQLGIVAQGQGNINAFVKNDFIVNTSRVFTLGGGSILIWSSDGSIDAGKGAKSALAVKVDSPYFDASNKLVIPAPRITTGSGIRTAAPPGVSPGDVFLFAPKGVVDAGEAGIGGTNVIIAATAVLGANNISVGGVSTGVPAQSSGSVAAGLTGASNMTANVTQVSQAATGVDDKEGEDSNNMPLGMLSVEVIGMGDG